LRNLSEGYRQNQARQFMGVGSGAPQRSPEIEAAKSAPRPPEPLQRSARSEAVLHMRECPVLALEPGTRIDPTQTSATSAVEVLLGEFGAIGFEMPVTQPPQPPKLPAPLRPGEAAYIRKAVRRYYGDDAVIRNYGPNPSRLELHVETDTEPGMEQHDCLGLLMCEISRDAISLEFTKRGDRIRGSAKIAYRQGQVL
jgi:hypothetical protein